MSKLITISFLLFCCQVLFALEEHVHLGEYWKYVNPYQFDEESMYDTVKQAMEEGKYQIQVFIQKADHPKLLDFIIDHDIHGNVGDELIQVTLFWNRLSVDSYVEDTLDLDPYEEFQQIEFPSLIKGIMSNDPARQLNATAKVAKLLAAGSKLSSPDARYYEKNLGVEDILDADLVPRFAEFLTYDQQPALQYLAASILGRVVYGSPPNALTVVNTGAVPSLVTLLDSADSRTWDMAVWNLGNIARDSFVFRDHVLQSGIMGPLLVQLNNETAQNSSLNFGSFTLSSLFRNKPKPSFDLISPALPTLARLIYSEDERVLSNACWTYVYHTDGYNASTQVSIDVEVAKRMVELMKHSSLSVQNPAIRTVTNIITGDPLLTQVMMNTGLLPSLLTLFQSSKDFTRTQACWIISQIVASNKNNIQAIIDAQIIPPLMKLVARDNSQAVWAVSDIILEGTPEQVKYMVSEGCIDMLCELLIDSDGRITNAALRAIDGILIAGNGIGADVTSYNPYAKLIEDAEGVAKIQALEKHANKYIQERAAKILQTYFA